MSGIIKLCAGMIIGCIIVKIFRYRSGIVEVSDFTEEIFNGFKAIVYSFLAWYIYITVERMKFPKIDVLTFLTFVSACLEASHNIINSLGNWLAFIVGIYILPESKFKNNKNHNN